MSVRVLIAAAVLAVAAPAVAQDAPAAPAAPAQAAPVTPVQPAAAKSPEEIALEAKAAAFEQRVGAMSTEMQAAIAASGGDQAKLGADLDAVVAKYQPEFDAFANELQSFLANPPASTPEAERAEMIAAAPTAATQIKGLPAMIKAQALQAGAQPAAPAAPAAPATPQ